MKDINEQNYLKTSYCCYCQRIHLSDAVYTINVPCRRRWIQMT